MTLVDKATEASCQALRLTLSDFHDCQTVSLTLVTVLNEAL